MNPVIDLSFPLRGSQIPADHAYLLYAAVSSLVPGLHNEESARSLGKSAAAPAGVGIHPIAGQLTGARQLLLTRGSALTVRIPSDQIGHFLPLAGRSLQVGSGSILTGVPSIRVLEPAASLRARIVTIRGALTADALLEKAHRDLAALGLSGPELAVTIPVPADPAPKDGGKGTRGYSAESPAPVRRTLRIAGKEIVGFPLHITGLTAVESLLLQERGLGGRRHLGCGIFVPVR